MATHSIKESIPPMPEPWQMLNDLAYRLDWVRRRAAKEDPVAANAEMRDALRAAMRELLTVVSFYGSGWEQPSDIKRDLVPRFTVMALHEDGTTSAHGIFATEPEAAETATHLTTEMADIGHTWVQRSLVSVALEQWREIVERILVETGLTEDELADAVVSHPVSSSPRRRRERPRRRTLAPAGD